MAFFKGCIMERVVGKILTIRDMNVDGFGAKGGDSRILLGFFGKTSA